MDPNLLSLFALPSPQPQSNAGPAGLLGGSDPAISAGMGLLSAGGPQTLPGSAVPRPMMGGGGPRPQMPLPGATGGPGIPSFALILQQLQQRMAAPGGATPGMMPGGQGMSPLLQMLMMGGGAQQP